MTLLTGLYHQFLWQFYIELSQRVEVGWREESRVLDIIRGLIKLDYTRAESYIYS